MGIKMMPDSIAWSVVELDKNNRPCNVTDFGVRLYPPSREAKSKEPLNYKRRIAKQSRRNRDRYLQRRKKLLNYMINVGLQPESKEERSKLAERDPWELRDKAATEEVTLFELGRALFHLNQRRGYQSNRVTDDMEELKQDGLLQGIETLQLQLDESDLTVGQLLNRLNKKTGKSIRLRYEDGGWNERFISRQMIKHEFNLLINKQAEFHQDVLINEVINDLHEIIFFQRPLVPPKIGRCSILGNTPRKVMVF